MIRDNGEATLPFLKREKYPMSNVVQFHDVQLDDVISAKDSGNETDTSYVCELCVSRSEHLKSFIVGHVTHDCICGVAGCDSDNHDGTISLYEIKVTQHNLVSDLEVKQIQSAIAAFSSYTQSPTDEQKDLIERAEIEGLVNVRANYLVSWTDKGIERSRSIDLDALAIA